MLYHEPQATRSGITAALLARENLPASETCLEGEAGFYNAFTGNNQGQLSHTFSFNPPGDGGPRTNRPRQNHPKPGPPLGTNARNPQNLPHRRLQLPRNRTRNPNARRPRHPPQNIEKSPSK